MIKLVSGTQTKIDHTPSSDLAAGDPVVIGSALTFPSISIDANKLGAVNWPSGTAVYELDNSGVAFTAGDQVSYHTTNKNAVANGAAGSEHFGIVVEDAATTDKVRAVHQLNAVLTET